ncbi:YbaK/EbsC family protein [uncultured Chloroflexus sp.]|uniref:YbaK/EbsC family protein n=1 Tax=uncultured Chloroflexus sp. TaxID=214040 RepID=UPI00263084BC|nr:YbaK/EbsC family protein [uncultured Chloroflexus sp.]
METRRQLTPEDVQQALAALGLEIQIMTFDVSTATAPQAAAAIGAGLGSIVKSLCFIIDDQPMIVLTAGDQRVDDRKLGALYNVSRKKVKIADAETTIAVTGYAPGGVPPIGHRTPLPVLIDQTLSRFEVVYAAAGSARSIFPIPFATLVTITKGRIVDVVKD